MPDEQNQQPPRKAFVAGPADRPPTPEEAERMAEALWDTLQEQRATATEKEAATMSQPQWSPSQSSYQKLSGEVGGLIEQVRYLTERVKKLETDVVELRATADDAQSAAGS